MKTAQLVRFASLALLPLSLMATGQSLPAQSVINLDVIGRYGAIDLVLDAAISGHYAYIADHTNGMQIIDISDPGNLRRIGSYRGFPGSEADAVVMNGSIIYVASYNAGFGAPGFESLERVDVNDPAHPQFSGFPATTPSGGYARLAASGNYIYMTGQRPNVQIFDVANPDGPQPVGAYGTDEFSVVSGMAASRQLLYVAAGFRGLEVLTVTNPASPQLVGLYNANGPYAADVALVGNHAYVADMNGGLLILDISQAENPRLIAVYPMGDCQPSCVAVSGNYAYVGSFYGGLDVIDVYDPANPRCVATNRAFGAWGVALSGDKIFVSAGRGGLQILRAFPPLNLTCPGTTSVAADTNCQALVPDVLAGVVVTDSLGLRVGLSQTPSAGTVAGVGNHTIVVTAIDAEGNTAQCSTTFTVLDQTPLEIVCPGGITAEFVDTNGVAVEFAPVVSNTCSGAPGVNSVPPSGSTFPIGTTRVVCTAVSASGVPAECNFQVTVLGARGVKQHVLNELKALQATASHADARRLDIAAGLLAGSLETRHWVDETHLRAAPGSALAMTEEAVAAGVLQSVGHSQHNPVTGSVLQGCVARIVKSDRLLALVRIQDAAGAGIPTHKLEPAWAEIRKGDARNAAGHGKEAIEHYRNAWKRMQELR